MGTTQIGRSVLERIWQELVQTQIREDKKKFPLTTRLALVRTQEACFHPGVFAGGDLSPKYCYGCERWIPAKEL